MAAILKILGAIADLVWMLVRMLVWMLVWMPVWMLVWMLFVFTMFIMLTIVPPIQVVLYML